MFSLSCMLRVFSPQGCLRALDNLPLDVAKLLGSSNDLCSKFMDLKDS
jgi:hypothetical protein